MPTLSKHQRVLRCLRSRYPVDLAAGALHRVGSISKLRGRREHLLRRLFISLRRIAE